MLQRLRHDGPDARVLLGRDRRDLDQIRPFDRPRHPLELGDDRFRGRLDTCAQQHRVGALVQGDHAFTHDRLSQKRRRRRAVARLIGRLVGDLAHELRAHVLVLVGELDLTRDGHAIVGDRRCSRQPFQNHIAPLRAQGHLHRVGERVDACLQQKTSLVIEVEALAHRDLSLRGDGGCSALQTSVVEIRHRVIDGVKRVLRGVQLDLALRGQRHQVLQVDVGADEVADEADSREMMSIVGTLMFSP